MDNGQTVFSPLESQSQQVQSPVSAPIQKTPPQAPSQAETKINKPSSVKRILKILLTLLLVVGFIGIIWFAFVNFFSNQSTIGQVKLTYWGLWEDSNIMQGIISDFERQNPKIKVEYVKQDI